MIAEIQERQAEIDRLCRRFRVRRLELFGSAATGAFRPDESDLDFLVDFMDATAPGYADRYFGFQESLEELFGRPVDLVVPGAVKNPYFLEAIQKTRSLVYAD